MNNLAFIFHNDFQLHKPNFEHVENPKRLDGIINKLEKENCFSKFDVFTPNEITENNLLLIHTKEHLNIIKQGIENGLTLLDDGDTYAVKGSIRAAKLAAGSLKTAVELVFNNKYKNVFCAVRPPGHHAEKSRVMGFCYFNNAALATQLSINNKYCKRVAIIDWDVHHGNGTQDIFYDRDDVLFISIQEFPLWPGTGKISESGFGKGKGFTLNFPVDAFSDGSIYKDIFINKIIPALKEFQPELIIVSAGFDAHKNDSISTIQLTETDYEFMTKIIKNYSKKFNIPIISTLEGGYNIEALSNSVFIHTSILAE